MAEWKDYQKWGFAVANRYRDFAEKNVAVGLDDLHQAAALAFVLADRSYTADKGSFINWYTYWVKGCCRRELGLDGRYREEHYNRAFLDAPIGEDQEDTLLDTIAAPDHDIPLEVKMDIENAIESLTDQQREDIHRRYWEGHSRGRIAAEMGITAQEEQKLHSEALRRLRRNSKIVDPVYRIHVSLKTFNTTHTSSTEKAALFNLEHAIMVNLK